MNFEITLRGLEKVQDNKLAIECLDCLKNEVVLFSKGFRKQANELTSLYRLRLNMAKDRKSNQLTEEEIRTWETAIKIMSESPSKNFHLNWIHSETKLYMLFWDSSSQELVSSFFFKTKRPLIESEKHYDEEIQNGRTVGAVKYSKQKKIKEWKNNA